MQVTREPLLTLQIQVALLRQPGARIRELVAMIDGVTTTTPINQILYKRADLFESIGPKPPRWYNREEVESDIEALVLRLDGVFDGVARPGVVESVRTDVAEQGASRCARLRSWQAEALEAWKANDRRGIVEAITGAGKTHLGLIAVTEELLAGGSSIIVVPRKELMFQWKRELESFWAARGIDAPPVRLLGGGHTDRLGEGEVLVGIVNSLRSRDPGGDQLGLLVADECHNYATEYNQLALKEYADSRLGLSATHRRSDDAHEHILLPYFADVVYELGYEKAIAGNVTAHFNLALVPAVLTPDERVRYDELSDATRNARWTLVSRFGVPDEPFGEFMKETQYLSEHGTMEEGIAAGRYLSAFSERRKLLAGTPAKVEVLDRLIPAFDDATGVLVFTETIESAKEIADHICDSGVWAEAIHSELSAYARRELFECFKSQRLKVIVAPRLLDEGVDVPDADLGVVIAASKERRQMIQRMGRVLRLKRDGRLARFVVVYAEDTTEDPHTGAHEVFLDEVTRVADRWEVFRSGQDAELHEMLTDVMPDEPFPPPDDVDWRLEPAW